MSCLPNDALSHFERREQELVALNYELEQKRAKAVAEASGAVLNAATAVDRHSAASYDGGLHAACASFATAEPSMGEATTTAYAEAALANALVSGAVHSPSDRDSGSEALHETIRSQHLRIIALQDELSNTIGELAVRNSVVHELRQECKQAASEQQRLQKVVGNAEQMQEREKKTNAELDRKHHDSKCELADLAKERDQLDVQKRKLEAEVVSKDARINRLTEECERYKTAAKDLGSQDRDRAVSDRRETDRLQGEVRKLERQRAELVNAFKKQMKLIDVLKRQRAHVEAARVLSFTEDEFIRILELGDKLGE